MNSITIYRVWKYSLQWVQKYFYQISRIYFELFLFAVILEFVYQLQWMFLFKFQRVKTIYIWTTISSAESYKLLEVYRPVCDVSVSILCRQMFVPKETTFFFSQKCPSFTFYFDSVCLIISKQMQNWTIINSSKQKWTQWKWRKKEWEKIICKLILRFISSIPQFTPYIMLLFFSFHHYFLEIYFHLCLILVCGVCVFISLSLCTEGKWKLVRARLRLDTAQTAFFRINLNSWIFFDSERFSAFSQKIP